MRDPRIMAQKLGSEVCAAKSSDGPNPYFAQNINNNLLMGGQIHFCACLTWVVNWTLVNSYDPLVILI